jgi:glycosyltransferase involved in cell wall biosynthesis
MKDSRATAPQTLRIAIIGHRGIPSSYGGFETFAEEIGKCLQRLGCSTVAYCRSNYFKEKPTTYHGIRLIYLHTISNKYLDTFFHSFISTVHTIIKNTSDVVIMVNVGNAPFALLAKLFGKKVIFCVDGLDWKRKKWGWFARTYLKICSKFAPKSAHTLITDAGSVQEFYRTYRHADSTMIPYGTEIDYSETKEKEFDELHKLNLESKNYFIYVARFEPENNPLIVDFSKTINNLVGQVMIATLILLGVVVFGIIAYAIYRMIHKSILQAKVDELDRMDRPAF